MSELLDVLRLMDALKIAVFGLMETRVFGGDLSWGKYRWIRGPELLPLPGGAEPRRGLGALVDTSVYPGAAAVWLGMHSFCLRLPSKSGGRPTFVFVCHVPILQESLARVAAFSELHGAIRKYRKMGNVVLGGDLNSRCAVNGDTRVKACGRQLLEFCDDTALSMVNSLEGVCVGEFSRTQVVRRRGLEYTNRTTIDYVLVDDICNVTRLEFLDVDDLDSDHKPLLLKLRVGRDDCGRVLPAPPSLPPKQRTYKLHNRPLSVSNSFETCCEDFMTDFMATAGWGKSSCTQEYIDQRVSDLTSSLHAAAATHFGEKKRPPKRQALVRSGDLRSFLPEKSSARCPCPSSLFGL